MRIPGGEKNKKSGQLWTKDELLQVYFLYKKLNGVGLHEHNPEIQKLAKSLGRTTRSAEAQTLMFRNLDRGGNYSHGNMNSLCKKIWEENENHYSDGIMEDSIYSLDILNNWRSETKGGVRKPFDPETGRPAGKDRFHTMVSKRIESLLQDKSLSPRAIFLVGGPGNGKTDTLEFIIETLDKENSLEGRLIKKAQLSFEDYEWRENIDLNEYKIGYKSLDLIQDASDTNSGTNVNSAEAFIGLLTFISMEDYDGLCICCINRGILDDVKRRIAKNSDDISERVKSVFNNLYQSVGPLGAFTRKPCWPSSEGFYAWPMDVDSIVDFMKEDNTLGENIIEKALSLFENSDLGEYWALQSNSETLRDGRFRKNFIKILRKAEINGSFRFTFREFFALTADIFQGIDQTKGRKKEIKDKETDFLTKFELTHKEWRNLYYNRLFNDEFHSLDIKTFLKNLERLKSPNEWNNDIYDARRVFNLFCSNTINTNTSIESLIAEKEFQSLDPGRSSSIDELNIDSTDLSFKKIEIEFSLGIDQGLELCKGYLNEIEKEYLTLLSKVENSSLDMDNTKKNFHTLCHTYKGILRMYAAIIAKRALGVRYGVTTEDKILKEYIEALNDQSQSKQRDFIRDCMNYAIYEDGKFKVSLGTSIGQPKEGVQDDVAIYFNKPDGALRPIAVSGFDTPDWALLGYRGNDNMKELIINYKLFSAIYKKGKLNLDAGCLSSEVLIGLDNIISSLATKKIHSHNELALLNRKMKLGEYVEISFETNGSFKLN